jgi:ParB family chromosome partitioning protein
MKVSEIPVAHIAPFRDRDRDPDKFSMLCRSMGKYGLIEPIILALNKQQGKKYTLVAGHGRLRAAKRLKWQKIRAVVKDEFEIADFLVENSRKEMTAYEQAVLVELDLRMGRSREELAEKFSVTLPIIDQYITVVRTLHPELQGYVRKKKISLKTAHTLAKKLPEQKAQETLVKHIKEAEKVDPSDRAVKRAVGDVMGAIRHRGSTDTVDSIEKLEKVRKEIKTKTEDTKEALSIIRSHWLKSVGEVKVLLKDATYRKLFDKHSISYKGLLN